VSEAGRPARPLREAAAGVEPLLRELAPRALGALARRHPGDFDACEDAVQEALLAAARQWPAEGVPDDPRAWLVAVAGRRLVDAWRSESARRAREEGAAALEPPPPALDAYDEAAAGSASASGSASGDEDDSLALLMLCCHPSLSEPSQIALTLRAVGGLTTGEIASAFLVPEATMGQRISRAKATIRAAGGRFVAPVAGEARDAALRAVLHVLYLMFNEGYTATSGPRLARAELTTEAIRLVRLVRERLPDDGEVAGLLALMLLTDARRPARTAPDGTLVPLAEQDRSLWRRAEIEEGVALVTDALARAPLGPYQLQAAIAAVHAEAPDAEATDWRQIVALYRLLMKLLPSNPMVSLNHAVAVAMADGPRAGLALLDDVEAALPRSHRPVAVRAHLLELAGDTAGALEAFDEAARRTTSLPERRYLQARAAALRGGG
jgi:RNA polymerase sigma factor (sigma-70 family)